MEKIGRNSHERGERASDVQATDGVKHAVEVEPAERNVVEGIVGQVQQELIADQNNNRNVDDSGVSNPVDDHGLVFVVSHVDIDRNLNIADCCVSCCITRSAGSETHVEGCHNYPPDLVSPNHSTVDVPVLTMVVAVLLLLDNRDISGDRTLQALLIEVAAGLFEIGLRPIERIMARVER